MDTDLVSSNNIFTNRLNIWQVQLGYEFGNSMVKAAYGEGRRSAFDGLRKNKYNIVSVGLDHHLSKRTTATLVYSNAKDHAQKIYQNDKLIHDKPEFAWSGISLGLVHKF